MGEPIEDLGAWGEQLALEFLKGQGLQILERNYRIPGGEIDLIARDRDWLVFLEVKTRRSDYFGLPCEAVGLRKQARIIKATQHFLQKHRMADEWLRFDVLGILLKVGKKADIQWIKDAFQGYS
jgi:putative endonuclease